MLVKITLGELVGDWYGSVLSFLTSLLKSCTALRLNQMMELIPEGKFSVMFLANHNRLFLGAVLPPTM